MNKQFRFLSNLLAILSLTVWASAQVPNGGFEQWVGGEPVDWVTNNAPGLFTTITQSSNSHSGSSAARGEVASWSGLLFPAFLFTEDTAGFPISQRYDTFNGFYQFSPQGNDVMVVWAAMYVGSISIGLGGATLPSATSGYTSFNIPIQYFTGDVPDHCYIYIFTGDSTGTVGGTLGTFFLLDDLTLSGVNGIDLLLDPTVPSEITLKQNYPNPFNPSTTIEFSLSSSKSVSLIVYNSLGQEVDRLVNEESMAAGTYRLTWRVENLPSGVYIYHLIAGNQIQSRKMILMK